LRLDLIEQAAGRCTPSCAMYRQIDCEPRIEAR
jgi:hypothetical protein